MVAAREVEERETYYYLDTRNKNNNEGKRLEEGQWVNREDWRES